LITDYPDGSNYGLGRGKCRIIVLKAIDEVESDDAARPSMERAKNGMEKPVRCTPIACQGRYLEGAVREMAAGLRGWDALDTNRNIPKYHPRSPCYIRAKRKLDTENPVERAGKYRRRALWRGHRQGRREIFAEG